MTKLKNLSQILPITEGTEGRCIWYEIAELNRFTKFYKICKDCDATKEKGDQLNCKSYTGEVYLG